MIDSCDAGSAEKGSIENRQISERIKRIQNAALQNTRIRKWSHEPKRNNISNWKQDCSTIETKIKAINELENGVPCCQKIGWERQCERDGLSISVNHGRQKLKLPSIRRNDRRRSLTLVCTEELKTKKKLSFDSSIDDLRTRGESCDEEGREKREQELVKLNEGDRDTTMQREIGDRLVENDNSSKTIEDIDLDNREGNGTGGIYRLCGHVSHKRSLSRKLNANQHNSEGSEKSQSEDESAAIRNQVPISEYLSKVDQFLKARQPEPAPKSLKVSKKSSTAAAGSRRTHFETQNRRTHSFCDGTLLNTSLYMNPFTKPNGQSWYYTAKEGRCRYLRVPLTPVLTVEEIFQSDSKKSD